MNLDLCLTDSQGKKYMDFIIEGKNVKIYKDESLYNALKRIKSEDRNRKINKIKDVIA